jgi:hypothetical protein
VLCDGASLYTITPVDTGGGVCGGASGAGTATMDACTCGGGGGDATAID